MAEFGNKSMIKLSMVWGFLAHVDSCLSREQYSICVLLASMAGKKDFGGGVPELSSPMSSPRGVSKKTHAFLDLCDQTAPIYVYFSNMLEHVEKWF